MGWPLRVEAPGAIYHVTSRAIEPMFVNDADRERFLALLARQVRDHGWICHAYCLMSNHVHLLLETPEPTLATGMRTLLSRYARGFNGRQGRRGPLVERRYHALLIEKESHLLEVSRYVVLNPVRAGLCADPSEWLWSSYRATVGLHRVPRFLATQWLLDQFGGSVELYRGFVADGAPSASLDGVLAAA